MSQDTSSIRTQIGNVQKLGEFRSGAGNLTIEDRKTIVEQALILLENAYVHLPLKIAMHAVNPLRKLRLIQLRLDEMNTEQMGSEIDFHREILEVFTSLRDLHTNYMLPKPFADHYAILPFLVESYSKDNKRRYLVTHVGVPERLKSLFPTAPVFPPTFKPGVDITYWNGMPIELAVANNANKNAGSNPAARHARGLDAMTIRPMRVSLPPDEEWVVIGYRTEDGQELEFRQDWLVVSLKAEARTVDPNSASSENSTKIGLDLTTDLVRQMKKSLFAPDSIIANESRFAMADSVEDLITEAEGLASVMPRVFRAEKISEDVGYIRIFTFDVDNDSDFIAEFVRLVNQLPKKGLIIDVRDNGGGLITAAERLLQLLTPRKIVPESYHFIGTVLALEITRIAANPSLKIWQRSLSEAVSTGSIYSRGFPITTIEKANDIGQMYYGPVILVTDALCYSATDLFAAGFQDHQIGKIIGTDGNTGAGGANVWTHALLRAFLMGSRFELKPLPMDSNMRVSIRRNERVGVNAGTPVEDLGIIPDLTYNMTRNDLLNRNQDLIKRGSELLASMPTRELEVTLLKRGEPLEIQLTTVGISRADIYVDGRPLLSQDISDGTAKLKIDRPGASAKLLEIVGLSDRDVVATKKMLL